MNADGRTPSPATRAGALRDTLALIALVLLSVLPYVGEIGFYSDDWSFLGPFRNAPDPSLPGIYRAAISPVTAMRPVGVMYLAGLYKLSGLNPFGYHLANAAVLAAAVVLLYLALRELGLRRSASFAAAAVFGTLPHYCTDRFWMSALPIVLSAALYLFSLYATLRTARERVSRGWKGLAWVSLLGSLLAYELFLPLFGLNTLLLWYRLRRIGAGKGATAVLLGVDLAAMAGVALFKAATTIRLYDWDASWHLRWFARLFRDALFISFGRYGWELPGRVAQLLADRIGGADILAAVCIGLLVAVWLYGADTEAESGGAARRGLGLAGAGLVVFFLGYAIFLTNTNAYITATGIANRIAIASALGVALVFVGGFRALSGSLPAWRRGVFALATALLCTAGSLVNSAIASYWVAAYDAEQEVLAALRERFPRLPSGSTLILDGVCPYQGPAIVFESHWDLAGALAVQYGDPSLKADVVTPSLKVEDGGLSTVIYGYYVHYPYGERLFVYHPGRDQVHAMTDAEAARAYFERAYPDLSRGCPKGHPGYGVPIFR
jgi:hypothetical protein